jgi:hypothetical protein
MSFDCQFFVEICKSNVTAICGMESTASGNSGIGPNHALLNPHSILVRNRCCWGCNAVIRQKEIEPSEISSDSDNYQRPRIVWGADRSAARFDSIRESSPWLTPCPLLGERPGSFYSKILSLQHLKKTRSLQRSACMRRTMSLAANYRYKRLHTFSHSLLSLRQRCC